MSTLSTEEVRKNVDKLLEDAEEAKKKSIPNALSILEQVGKLLPQLAAPDNDKRSNRNVSVNKDTQEVLYLSKRGNILYELKEYTKALVCYQTIKNRLNNNTEVHKALGDCLRKMGQFKEALEIYNEGCEVSENDDLCSGQIKAALFNSRGLTHMELKDYQNAFQDFEAAIQEIPNNPLYLCNKGYAAYAMKNKDIALKAFQAANALVKAQEFGDLTGQNIEFIQKALKEFVEGLEVIESVSLAKPDPVMQARELNFIKSNLNALTNSEDDQNESEEQKNEGENKGNKAAPKINFSAVMAAQKLQKIKLDIQKIQDDPRLFQFYDGFMFDLSQSFLNAVIIQKGDVLIDTGSNELDLLTSALKLVPIIGEQLSSAAEKIGEFANSKAINDAATNICKFASSSSMFEEIVQEALIKTIEKKQLRIKALKDYDLDKVVLPNWASRFQKILNRITKLKGNAEKKLFGSRNDTALQKFGFEVANILTSDHIASGKIYEGQTPVLVKRNVKIERLIKAASEVFDECLDNQKKVEQAEQLPQIQGAEKAQGAQCCSAF